MQYSEKEKTKLVDTICNWMKDGYSLRSACIQENVARSTFLKWVKDNEAIRNQYACACEDRTEKIVDEIIDIADDSTGDVKRTADGTEVIDNEAIQRSRLRVDARKWLVGKLNPKKYGDKVDVTTGGDKLPGVSTLVLPDFLKEKSKSLNKKHNTV